MRTSLDMHNLHNDLDGKLNLPFEEKMQLIENSSLNDPNYIKRINGLLRLKERRSIHVENWK